MTILYLVEIPEFYSLRKSWPSATNYILWKGSFLFAVGEKNLYLKYLWTLRLRLMTMTREFPLFSTCPSFLPHEPRNYWERGKKCHILSVHKGKSECFYSCLLCAWLFLWTLHIFGILLYKMHCCNWKWPPNSFCILSEVRMKCIYHIIVIHNKNSQQRRFRQDIST